jgi:hypothetical protein
LFVAVNGPALNDLDAVLVVVPVVGGPCSSVTPVGEGGGGLLTVSVYVHVPESPRPLRLVPETV